MICSRSIAIAISLFLPLSPISAQSDSTASSSTQAPKWEFSLGADPTDLDLRTRDPGVDLRFVSTLTRNWQRTGSRFSRQLSLMVGADAPRGTGPSFLCYGCWSRVTKQYVGLTGGLAADLFHAWRFTPYLHTGAGVYYTHLGGGMSTFDGANWVARPPRKDFSSGVNGGFGVKAKLFSHEFFIDETLHAFDVHTIDRGVYPLSIGIRW